jgi:hypothetical protein
MSGVFSRRGITEAVASQPRTKVNFEVWAPDAAIRRMILVQNPARLYGF